MSRLQCCVCIVSGFRFSLVYIYLGYVLIKRSFTWRFRSGDLLSSLFRTLEQVQKLLHCDTHIEGPSGCQTLYEPDAWDVHGRFGNGRMVCGWHRTDLSNFKNIFPRSDKFLVLLLRARLRDPAEIYTLKNHN